MIKTGSPMGEVLSHYGARIDPRVLAWLVDYQRSQLTIPEYPVDRTPNMVVDPASGACGGP